MRRSAKPVRKCHACLLNLDDHCWVYPCPRDRWRDGRTCPGFGNADLYHQFREWQKEPAIKTRRELRREFFRKRTRTEVRRIRQTKTRRGRG